MRSMAVHGRIWPILLLISMTTIHTHADNLTSAGSTIPIVAPSFSIHGSLVDKINLTTSLTASVSASRQNVSFISSTNSTLYNASSSMQVPPAPGVNLSYLCKTQLSHWSPGTADTCPGPLKSSCAKNVVNETSFFLGCRKILGYNPSASFSAMSLLPLLLETLGLQLAMEIAASGLSPRSSEDARKVRFITNEIVFESGLELKYSQIQWPVYTRRDLYPQQNWNGRNDTITLPFVSIPSETFLYSLVMLDSLVVGVIDEEYLRLKKSWSKDNVISSGVYIDRSIERDIFFKPSLEINSAVLSLAISPAPRKPLISDVTVAFRHLKDTMMKPWCVYWQKLQGEKGANGRGYWTNFGMRVVSTNRSMTVCTSNHLSSFAVVMEPYADEDSALKDPFVVATSLMTFISMVILFLYVVAMCFLGCTKTYYSRMYIYIALSCFVSQSIFVFGLSQTDTWGRCTMLGTIMQACHISVVCWIALESVHQLSRIRYFFNEKTNLAFLYNLTGFGFPLAVLVALVGFPYRDFEHEVKFCWIYVTGEEIWFFAGPLVLLMVVSVGFRMVTYIDITKDKSIIERDINYKRAWRSLQASAFFIPVLGFLWLMATFGMTKSGDEATRYLIFIPILNLLVGIMVFVFYFYKNDEVRDAIMEQVNLRKEKKRRRYEQFKGFSMAVEMKH